jgi:hypothetical protein
MELKKLIFTAQEDGGETFEFEGYELPTGEVCVPYETSPDGWFANRSEVEANGNAVVIEISETGETVEIDVAESVAASALEFGDDAIPASLLRVLFFGRLDETGNVQVFYADSGERATRLPVSGVYNTYPETDRLGVRYEHPDGIVITRMDAGKIGIEVEQ